MGLFSRSLELFSGICRSSAINVYSVLEFVVLLFSYLSWKGVKNIVLELFSRGMVLFSLSSLVVIFSWSLELFSSAL